VDLHLGQLQLRSRDFLGGLLVPKNCETMGKDTELHEKGDNVIVRLVLLLELAAEKCVELAVLSTRKKKKSSVDSLP
jgi:hypothetical protein